MAKHRRGYVSKDKKSNRWFARITFTDSTGRRKNISRRAATKPEARALLRELLRRFDAQSDGVAFKTERLTFETLVDAYRELKVKPAEYRGDRKIAGLRSSRTVAYRVEALLEHFGKMRLSAITLGEIERFKSKRLATKTKSGTERAIASVHRELEVLRSMLRYARNEGWIEHSPFERTSIPLISKADEGKRIRVLSQDEERRLLKACINPHRQHLLPLIVAAVDTGARKGELLSLTWNDVDLKAGIIQIRAVNTKTAQCRSLPISNRLAFALKSLQSDGSSGDDSVFKLSKIQRSWNTACREAGIDDLRFHDLRHTFCTRMVQAGMPLAEIAKISGHTQLNTLYRHYINTTQETLAKATELLNQMSSNESQIELEELRAVHAKTSLLSRLMREQGSSKKGDGE